MPLNFVPVDRAHAQALVAWLAGDRWPYHGNARPSPEVVRRWIDGGRFWGDDVRSHWIEREGERIGLAVLEELDDPTPVFDLRIRSAARRQGVGRQTLVWLAEQAFDVHDKHRLEAHVRADNAAMRGLLEAVGWVQEAYYRQAWPDAAGAWHDATTYTLLREDHRSGGRTPLPPHEPVR